ncbi:MAG: exosortase/archaeosortase family protein, partial [Bacteroidetes bacterium]|nr:exosortase/archaeosortase family protein [Bacteroidota bacterium]
VAPSCSGIRYLVSYFVFGLAYAWLSRDTLRDRVLIVAATIPISIIAGVGRLSAIFILCHAVSPYWGGQQPHIVVSWINFGVVGGFFFALDQYFLRKKEKQAQGE